MIWWGRNRKPTFRLPSLLKDVEQEFLQIKGPKPYPTGFAYSNHRSGRFIFWQMVIDIISSVKLYNSYTVCCCWSAKNYDPPCYDSQVAAFDRISSPGHIAVWVIRMVSEFLIHGLKKKVHGQHLGQLSSNSICLRGYDICSKKSEQLATAKRSASTTYLRLYVGDIPVSCVNPTGKKTSIHRSVHLTQKPWRVKSLR